MKNSGTASTGQSSFSKAVGCRPPQRKLQRGAALLILLTVLTLWGLSLFIGQLNVTQNQIARTPTTATALSEAKQALIGDAIAQTLISSTGYLRLPDIGVDGFGTPTEGNSAANFAGNSQDLSILGKLPWRTLGTPVLRDADGECLWYAVSGRFKIQPKTAALNWDTPGQIDVIDNNGSLAATNLAALIVSPGRSLDGQDRAGTEPAYAQCSGNYDARNYLDAFDAGNALYGEVNYFAGSLNNRSAPNTNNKRFALAATDHYNDQLIFITTEDIFTPIIRRDDFRDAINSLMNDPQFSDPVKAIVIAGSKGIDNLDCSTSPAGNAFCKNWREMLFLTQLTAPAPVTIDGLPSGNCNRVLLFSGARIAGQNRISAAEKSDKNNYLEGANLASFNAPIAIAANFSGASFFDWQTPGTDLIRCLP